MSFYDRFTEFSNTLGEQSHFKYKESGIQRKKPLRLKMEKILIGFKIKCLIFIQKPSYRWKFNLAICEDDFSKAAPKHCFDNASIRSATVVRQAIAALRQTQGPPACQTSRSTPTRVKGEVLNGQMGNSDKPSKKLAIPCFASFRIPFERTHP
ncbi:hypothetical protein SAMN05720469_1611 [Fibrobacter intestinalis]|uniref:Uncharacterized protein n=1 Tax=Fibrobacter intestinalis TaxID=28122 RepID=A0A1M6ZG53_9BACT|nr:hypothetical protein SAMN05720469_1611 [Fibrobacter intestinalis]